MDAYQEGWETDAEAHVKLGISDQSVRVGLIRKVYLILTSQLALTALICVISVYTPFGDFQLRSTWAYILSLVVLIVTLLLLCFVGSLAQEVPINYILLGVFTLAEAYSVSLVVKTYTTQNLGHLVLIAAILTFLLTAALTIYAHFTKSDFTTYGPYLFVWSMVLLFLCFLALFTHNKWLHILISALTIGIYGTYLVYDSQLVAGGKRCEITPDLYIMGAMRLYIDIIVIFTEILKIISSFGGKNT